MAMITSRGWAPFRSKRQDRWSALIPTLKEGHRIPKVIHQIFLNGCLPDSLSANVERLVAANPGWEHRLYDLDAAENFIAQHWGDTVLAAFRRIDPAYAAARADLLRYLIVYKQGGVYLDIRSGFDRPIDEVLRGDEGYVLSQWRNGPGECFAGAGLHKEISHIPGGEFQIFHIIAVAGHPFLRAAIVQVLRNIASYKPWNAVGRNGVLRTTGPIAFTLAVEPLLATVSHTRIVHEGEIGLSCSSINNQELASSFAPHYSTLKSPVVRLSGIGKVMSSLFALVRASRHNLLHSRGI